MLQAIQDRRSIRKYKQDEVTYAADLDRQIKAAEAEAAGGNAGAVLQKPAALEVYCGSGQREGKLS